MLLAKQIDIFGSSIYWHDPQRYIDYYSNTATSNDLSDPAGQFLLGEEYAAANIPGFSLTVNPAAGSIQDAYALPGTGEEFSENFNRNGVGSIALWQGNTLRQTASMTWTSGILGDSSAATGVTLNDGFGFTYTGANAAWVVGADGQLTADLGAPSSAGLSRSIEFDPSGNMTILAGGEDLLTGISAASNVSVSTGSISTSEYLGNWWTGTSVSDGTVSLGYSNGNIGFWAVQSPSSAALNVLDFTLDGSTQAAGQDFTTFYTSTQTAQDSALANGAVTSSAGVLQSDESSIGQHSANGTPGDVGQLALDSGQMEADFGSLVTEITKFYIPSSQSPPSYKPGTYLPTTPSHYLPSNNAFVAATNAGLAIGQQLIDSQQHFSDINVDVLGFGGVAGSPLVLDLTGNGIDLVDEQNSSATFDIGATGTRQRVSWIGPSNGFLVFDRNHNGQIDSAAEWFGEKFSATGAAAPSGQTGFSALATLATPGATSFSAATSLIDPATGKPYFAEVQVWIDANGDGQVESGELFGLAELGIKSISLQPASVNQSVNGNLVESTSTYTLASGASRTIDDIGLATSAGTQQTAMQESPADLEFLQVAAAGMPSLAAGQAWTVEQNADWLQSQSMSGVLANIESNWTRSEAISAIGYAKAGTTLNPGNPSDITILTPIGYPSSFSIGSVAYYLNPTLERFAPAAPVFPAFSPAWYAEREGYYTYNVYVYQSNAPQQIVNILDQLSTAAQIDSIAASGVNVASSVESSAQQSAVLADTTPSAATISQAVTSAANASAGWVTAVAAILSDRTYLTYMGWEITTATTELNKFIATGSGVDVANGTFWSAGDAVLAANAFDGLSQAETRFADIKDGYDKLLGAVGQDGNFAQVQIADSGSTVTGLTDRELLIAGAGAAFLNAGSGQDEYVISSQNQMTTIVNFKANDILDFLTGSTQVAISSDGGAGTYLVAGASTVHLTNDAPNALDLSRNIIGVSGGTCFGSAITPAMLSPPVYDARPHL